MRRPLLPFLLLLGSMTAAAASHDWKTDDRGVLVAIARAPVKARAWKNPYDGQAEAVRAGEKLFFQHCAGCHGEDAHGRGHAANLRSAGVQLATPGELVWLLRNGNLRAGMPPWAGLPPERLWQIAAYVKTLH